MFKNFKSISLYNGQGIRKAKSQLRETLPIKLRTEHDDLINVAPGSRNQWHLNLWFCRFNTFMAVALKRLHRFCSGRFNLEAKLKAIETLSVSFARGVKTAGVWLNACERSLRRSLQIDSAVRYRPMTTSPPFPHQTSDQTLPTPVAKRRSHVKITCTRCLNLAESKIQTMPYGT